jgi:nicotinate-nucleotide adenylyltransferase
MDFAELCSALDERLDVELSAARAAHSRRVAKLAAAICAREGLDPEQGRAAGLAHDICKELPRKAQRELAARFSGAAESSALMADKVVHGPAAAALLARDYGVTDPALLDAIALHTVGRPGMGELAAILYCADKLEPGRERLSGAYRRRCLSLPLDAMLLAVVEGVIDWMKSQGKAVAPETLILYSTLDPRAVRE